MHSSVRVGVEMAYQEEISRTKPSAFLFLVDQSGSMGAPFGHADKRGRIPTKAEVVADALNATLSEVINRCSREEGIRDYFEVGIIGYGQSAAAAFCWESQLAGRQMVPLSEVKRAAATQSVEEENVVRGKSVTETVEYSVWLKATAAGGTPMRSAMELAKTTLENWLQLHTESYPPIVINITDGAATDIKSEQELLSAANAITALTNKNGSGVLFINCHISERGDSVVVFPSRRDQLPQDSYAHILFEMSSVLPPQMNSVAAEILGRPVSSADPIRGMVFNGSAIILVKFLEIGTRPAIQNMDIAPTQ